MPDKNKMKAAMGGSLKGSRPKDDLFANTSDRTSTPEQSSVKTSSNSKAKMELYPQRVTVALSAEQEQFLDVLSKEFKAKRTKTEETINKNTLVRCLVRLLQDLKFTNFDVANNEQELESLLRTKLIR
jgi:hypothetical protein